MYDPDSTPQLAEVVGALEEMAPTDLASVPVGVLTDQVQAWCQAVSRLHAVGAELLAAWDAQCGWADDKAVSAAQWLRAFGEIDNPTRAVKVARRLRDWAPITSAALAAGELSYTKAEVMMLAVTPELADEFARAEQTLVDTARVLTVRQTVTLMRRWRSIAQDMIDTGDTDPAEALRDERACKLWETFGGMVACEGVLDPEVGQAFLTAIAEREQRLFRHDVADARARAAEECGCDDPDHHGPADDPDDPAGLPLARTPTQRRADALAELIFLGLNDTATGGDDRAGGPTTKVVVTVSATELARATLPGLDHETTGCGHDHGDADDHVECPLVADPVARLARDVVQARFDDLDRPVDDTTLATLACDCTIVRMVLDAAGVPIDLGRERRLVSPHQRRALVQRDGGCVFPGCDRPPRWCDAHHILPWEHGGPTDLHNLVLLCRHHHRAMHQRDPWIVRIDPTTGRPAVNRPDGTTPRPLGLPPPRGAPADGLAGEAHHAPFA